MTQELWFKKVAKMTLKCDYDLHLAKVLAKKNHGEGLQLSTFVYIQILKSIIQGL